MNVTRRDLRVTAGSIALQCVAAIAVSLLAGVIWSRFDGSPLLPRWSDALAIAGPVWLIGSGTFASKTTVMSYMKWGIRERNETLYGDDIGASDAGMLTSFGEALVVGILLIVLSIWLG